MVNIQRKVPGRSENGFELADFRVIGVKITVNIWGNSKGNQFCVEVSGISSYRTSRFKY